MHTLDNSNAKIRTIFISSFHGSILRNILLTEALGVLRRTADVRVVIFVPHYKKEYFERHVGGGNVFIEGINFGSPSKKISTLIMKRLARLSLNTATARVEKKAKWKREGKFFYFIYASFLGIVMEKFFFLFRLMRFIDFYFSRKKIYLSYFLKYTPSVVFTTDIQQEKDVELMHNARALGVKTVGMVRNWDNLTSHGLLRVEPDILLVGSSELKKQAITLNRIPEERVHVTGIPHHDRYIATIKKGPEISRSEFLSSLGFSNPNKRFIVLALIGDWYIPDNSTDSYLIEMATSWDANVLVRFHPTVPIDSLKNVTSPAPHVIFDRPGFSFKDDYMGDREIDPADDIRLMNSLYFADTVVCGPTTLALDAASVFDKPVILIDFHRAPRTFKNRILKYECDHFLVVQKCNAMVRACSKEMFDDALDQSLAYPKQHAEGRMCLRQAYGGPQDGHSGERVAQTLLNIF